MAATLLAWLTLVGYIEAEDGLRGFCRWLSLNKAFKPADSGRVCLATPICPAGDLAGMPTGGDTGFHRRSGDPVTCQEVFRFVVRFSGRPTSVTLRCAILAIQVRQSPILRSIA